MKLTFGLRHALSALSLFVLLLTGIAGYSQTKETVSGTVRDSAGNSLPSVTVKEKGGKGTAITDDQGHFTLKASANATLVITAVGYTSQEVRANGNSGVSVRLMPNSKELSEVVVTGFGTRTDTRKLSYAVCLHATQPYYGGKSAS